MEMRDSEVSYIRLAACSPNYGNISHAKFSFEFDFRSELSCDANEHGLESTRFNESCSAIVARMRKRASEEVGGAE